MVICKRRKETLQMETTRMRKHSRRTEEHTLKTDKDVKDEGHEETHSRGQRQEETIKGAEDGG